MKAVRTLLIIVATALLCSCTLSSCKMRNTEVADVHVFYYTYSDTYVSSVRAALDAELKKAGVSFQDYDGNSNQTTQTEQIQTAITKGAKVIAVNIVNTGSDDAANAVVNLAKNAGIPVVFFNREVSDSVIKSYDKCAFVGTSAEESGILQGQMIGEYVKANFEAMDINKDGKISYILFKGEEGNNEAIYRTKFAVEEADKILTAAGKPPLSFYDPNNPNKYLVDRNGQWSASAANEYMTTALTSFNENSNKMIELVICNNDGMAEGAISALNASGYNTGAEGARIIPVFGVDATDAAKELISKKKMTGTIKQDAEGMAIAICKLCVNGCSANGPGLLSGMDDYTVDAEVSKIRIPYSKYTG
ncbi:MAG: galactose ABC transporter substrate-binding protein [Clostridia bacterium]|nr:galactose ABC transporter substrate-binding protein [Clostridia bacterium]